MSEVEGHVVRQGGTARSGVVVPSFERGISIGKGEYALESFLPYLRADECHPVGCGERPLSSASFAEGASVGVAPFEESSRTRVLLVFRLHVGSIERSVVAVGIVLAGGEVEACRVGCGQSLYLFCWIPVVVLARVADNVHVVGIGIGRESAVVSEIHAKETSEELVVEPSPVVVEK